jgi:glutamate racemase
VADHSPIGIFDSGVGGLTVFRELTRLLPHESLVYLGDTARVPYGSKSPDTVIRYASACAEILLQRQVKMLVVACNTASAHALEALWDRLDIPVVGVIEPGAQAAVRQSTTGRIGVIGTVGTIGSGVYPQTIRTLLAEAEVFCKACPLFVPLVEEGWTEGPVPQAIAARYLEELLAEQIDTLVLGCTHYPLLSETIGAAVGAGVALVDSAEATALVVQQTLDATDLGADSDQLPFHQFLASDSPQNFAVVAKRFLGYDVADVEWVDF